MPAPFRRLQDCSEQTEGKGQLKNVVRLEMSGVCPSFILPALLPHQVAWLVWMGCPHPRQTRAPFNTSAPISIALSTYTESTLTTVLRITITLPLSNFMTCGTILSLINWIPRIDTYFFKINSNIVKVNLILLNIMFHAPMRRFQLELTYYFTYFSIVIPSNICVFLSCRLFVVNTTFSTGLVGVEVTSVS